jgi:hypothetical protein
MLVATKHSKWARTDAASGHDATAPPSSVMNSRRAAGADQARYHHGRAVLGGDHPGRTGGRRSISGSHGGQAACQGNAGRAADVAIDGAEGFYRRPCGPSTPARGRPPAARGLRLLTPPSVEPRTVRVAGGVKYTLSTPRYASGVRRLRLYRDSWKGVPNVVFALGETQRRATTCR